MTLLRSLLLPLAALTTASALRITSITNSGPSCPTSTTVTWDGTLSNLALHLDAFDASLDAKSQTQCTVQIAFADGRVGSTLNLGRVTVNGGLTLAANSEARFISRTHWDTGPSSAEPSSSEFSQSSTRGFSDDVSVSVNSGLRSPCIGASGTVGTLTVQLYVMAVAGSIEFGPAGSSAVKETLGLTWQEC